MTIRRSGCLSKARSFGKKSARGGYPLETRENRMFVRFWLFLLSVIALVVALISSHWFWAAVLFVVSGSLWVSHDITRPYLQRPMVLSNALEKDRLFPLFLSVFLWPLRVFMTTKEKWSKMYRNPDRFLVAIGTLREYERWFSNWHEARAYGQRIARELQLSDKVGRERVSISDGAIFWWQRSYRDDPDPWKSALYHVLPSGELEPRWERNRLSWSVLSHKLVCRIVDIFN